MSLTCDVSAIHTNGVDVYKFSLTESKSLHEPTVHPISTGSTIKIFKYSNAGHLFCFSSGLRSFLYDSERLVVLHEFENRTSMTECLFSPGDSLLCLNETFHPSENPNNLKIWRLSSKADGGSGISPTLVFSFSMKACGMTGTIGFSFDDRLLSKLDHGKLTFFETTNGSKIECNGNDSLQSVTSHILMGSLLGGENQAIDACLGGVGVGCFIKGTSGKPSTFKIFRLTDLTKPLCQKSCFNADSVEYLLNNSTQSKGSGSANKSNVRLLLNAVSKHDTSGKSYYGQSFLYLFSIAISSSNCLLDCRVDFDKDGPVHAYSWSPEGNEFVVLYGFMPSSGTIFNGKCQVQHSLGEVGRNAVRYNQNGSLFYLGGFGNISGYIDVWHRKAMKKLSSFQEPGTTICEWLVDGAHLLTATLSPRLRVDNGFKVFNVMGQKVFGRTYNELFGAHIRPFSFEIPTLSVEECQARSSPLLETQTIKKPSAYIPPSLRKQLAAESVSQKPPTLPKSDKSPEAIEGRIRTLTKKLEEISVLKQKTTQGYALNEAQQEKVKREPAIFAELATLQGQTKSS